LTVWANLGAGKPPATGREAVGLLAGA